MSVRARRLMIEIVRGGMGVDGVIDSGRHTGVPRFRRMSFVWCGREGLLH